MRSLRRAAHGSTRGRAAAGSLLLCPRDGSLKRAQRLRRVQSFARGPPASPCYGARAVEQAPVENLVCDGTLVEFLRAYVKNQAYWATDSKISVKSVQASYPIAAGSAAAAAAPKRYRELAECQQARRCAVPLVNNNDAPMTTRPRCRRAATNTPSTRRPPNNLRGQSVRGPPRMPWTAAATREAVPCTRGGRVVRRWAAFYSRVAFPTLR